GLASAGADVAEGRPGSGPRGEIADRTLRFGSGIALVACEPIARILRIEFGHQPVSINLGNDRSRCDGKIDAVDLVEAVLWLRETRDGPAVDQDVLRRRRQIHKPDSHTSYYVEIDAETSDLTDLDQAYHKQ